MAIRSVDRAILFRLATSEWLERAVRRAPSGERLAWRAASRYVAGSGAAAAVQRARDLAADGVAASLDLFGELVRDPAEADRVTAGYLALADQLGGLPPSTWLAVDLSHLALDTDPGGRAARGAAAGPRSPLGRAGLVARQVPVRVYVPSGPDWFRFWMRRVAESRGA
jgi:proline dehydrogenase